MFGWQRKKKEPDSDMTIAKGENGVFVVTIRGRVTAGMWTQLEVFGADLIDKVGFIKVLMNLADFLGWSGKPGDGNLDFIQKYDSKIKKIAVVGAWEWKENINDVSCCRL